MTFQTLLPYFLYFIIGAAEWFLALVRTLAIIKRRPVVVACTLFVENMLGLLILSQFILQNDWCIAVAYSVGAAFGGMLPLLRKQKK